MKELKKGDSMH